MIKYRLKCKNCENSFDSWFSSSLEFEKLKKNQFLNCHFCNSKKIIKNPMAPNILSLKQNLKNEIKIKKTKILEKNFWSFKILLKIILKMSVTTLLIKLGLYTLIEKKLKVSMETQRKTRLKNYMMKVLKLTLSLG